MSSYQEAKNDYNMLKGCVNRIFVTDDMEELPGCMRERSIIWVISINMAWRDWKEEMRRLMLLTGRQMLQILIRMLDLTLKLLKN